ncbi:MAG: sugar translocase [Lachnospiraceae bacterium]|nr:sugar translocase [Lachnospiraceae bacterium]
MGKRTRTEYSYLNIIAGVGGYSISIILSLINRMIFTRTLPSSYLGLNGLFGNILSMLTLAELGIGGAIVYALYKPLAEDNTAKIAALVKLFGRAYRIIGCVIGVAGLCLMPFLKMIIGEHPDISDNLYIIFAMFLFSTASSYFFSYRSTLLTAAQQNYYNTGLNYLIISIQAIVQAVYLIITKDYIGYLIIQIIGNLLYYILISQIAVKKFPYIKDKNIQPLAKEEEKSIFKNVRDLMIYKVSGVLVNGTDNIIITYFSGLVVTGVSSNYTLLVNTLTTLLNQIFDGVTASLGNLNAVETKDKRFSILNMMSLLNFWLFGWGAIGIIFVSDDMVTLLFGSGYVLDMKIPIVLALNFYTVGMMNAIWNFKHTMGMFRYGRFVQFGTALCNLVFSLILGYFWGLFGVLFATFLSRAITNLWYDPYVVYKHGFGKNPLVYLKKYLNFAGILLGTICVCGIICRMVNYGIFVNVIIKCVVCTLIPNVIFYIIFRKYNEFMIIKNIVHNGIVIIKNKLAKK